MSVSTESTAADFAHRSGANERSHSFAPRSVALLVHRYVGLVMAAFLALAALTGSALTFNHELDALINPGLLRVQPASNSIPPLGPIALRESLRRKLPADSVINIVPLDLHPGEAASFFATIPAASENKVDDEFFVDPYSGALLGSRRHGDIRQGLKNLMPFMFELHYSLALGTVGSYLMGVVALLWTLDCFVGAYLTMPVRRVGQRGNHAKRGWFGRWIPAWLLRAGKLFSLVFTWHRASGLWLWGILLMFGWSAVSMNLREVYNPVMGAVFEMHPNAYDSLPIHTQPRVTPKLSWSEAYETGRTLMAQQAALQGMHVISERRLRYNAPRGAFSYQVRSSRDVSQRLASTTVWFDGDTGRLLMFESPTGQHSGHTVTSWLYAMHFADIAAGGTTYRIAVCVLGVAIALLSVTGIWIWWKKRGKRSRSKLLQAAS